jgi:purine-cytosine permease-like protein
MPGLLMGVLQVGWMSVNAFVATTFILTAFGSKAGPGSLPFGLIAAVWALGLGYVGAKGIHYVARFALYLNFVPLLMILVVFAKNAGGIGQYLPAHPNSYLGFTMLVQIVVGFFATAGAAGVDFGMSSRNERDVRWVAWLAFCLQCWWPEDFHYSRLPAHMSSMAFRTITSTRLSRKPVALQASSSFFSQ